MEDAEALVASNRKAVLVKWWDVYVVKNHPRSYVLDFEKKSVRDVRRHILKWLEGRPEDTASLRRYAAAKAAEPKKARAPSKTPAVKTDDLRTYIAKRAKSDLIEWLRENDSVHSALSGSQNTSYYNRQLAASPYGTQPFTYYNKLPIASLRDFVLQRAAHNPAAVAEAVEKRSDERIQAAKELEMIRLTAAYMHPGVRFALHVVLDHPSYDRGTGTVDVEVVAYVADPQHELDLAKAKRKHSKEVPDARLIVRVVGHAIYTNVGAGYSEEKGAVTKGNTLTFTLVGGVWHWQTYWISANITLARLLDIAEVRQGLARPLIANELRPSQNYTSPVSKLIAGYL